MQTFRDVFLYGGDNIVVMSLERIMKLLKTTHRYIMKIFTVYLHIPVVQHHIINEMFHSTIFEHMWYVLSRKHDFV